MDVLLNGEVKYTVSALALGLGWFGLLLIPDMSRNWLLDVGGGAVFNVFALLLTSVATAYVFRRLILGASRPLDHIILGLLIPLPATVFYLTLSILFTMGFIERMGWNDIGGIFYGAGMFLLSTAWLVFPYSLLCQFVMNRAGRAAQA